MSNPWKDYLQNFRDNLPTGVTYREDIARYIFNDKHFILPNDVVRYKNYLEKLGFGETFDPDAQTYITAVETADGEPLEAGVKDAINDFVVGCKADGIWDALKASCIMAGARTLNGCLVPLVGSAPTNFNFVSADYDRVTGLKGDGSTKYLDSNRANDADTQNSNHNSVFVTVSPIESGFFMGSGNVGNSGVNVMYRRDNNDFAVVSQGDGRSGVEERIANQGDVPGFKGISRNTGAEYTARTGGQYITVTRTSAAPNSNNLLVFSSSGVPFIDPRLSFYSIGESIDLAALDTRVSALMTAIDGAIA